MQNSNNTDNQRDKEQSLSHIIEITTEENNILVDLAFQIFANPSNQPELFCLQSKECSEKVPQRIKIILQSFAKNGTKTGYLMIKNILFDNIAPNLPFPISMSFPKTPDNNNSKIGENTMLARIQSILLCVIAEIVSYEAEGYGRLFQDVVPIKKMENEQTSVGSNTELEIHTEQAFSKLRPDILSLACIRGDPLAQTYILPVKSILENLYDEERELLRLPLWKTGVDLSFKLNQNEFIEGDIRGPFPIISGDEHDPKLVFDQDLMFGINEESNNLFKKVIDIYYQYRNQHNLQTGEIILIDNMRAVHGRSSFYPKYDGADRFLIRCFAVYDYEFTSYARTNNNNSRMISAIYS
jgi:L-asparagine oxygenase